MDPRKAAILRAVVREFIENGAPVSSESLYDRYDFGIKPAMIRLELNDLTSRGYLDQPHHAAGRVPSDFGYEFFANYELEAAESAYDRQMAELLERRAWSKLLGRLSEELGVLSVAVIREEQETFKGPLENLLDALDWHSREEIKALVRDFEGLDTRMEQACNNFHDTNLRVFVGKSPVTESDFLSVMAGEYDLGDGKVLIWSIGPKRMDYGKAAKMMKGLNKKRVPNNPISN